MKETALTGGTSFGGATAGSGMRGLRSSPTTDALEMELRLQGRLPRALPGSLTEATSLERSDGRLVPMFSTEGTFARAKEE